MQQTRAVVRLDAVRSNAQLFRAAAGTKLCAVVKADAYGHGAAEVARALRMQADCFAVALVEEGAQLRHAGIGGEILVLCPPLTEEEALRAAYHGLTVTVSDRQDVALLARACARFGVRLRCHLKVNTGMNRFGFDEEPLAAALASRWPRGLRVEGIYSHFYRPEDRAATEAQFALFLRMAERAQQRFGRLCRHIAATGGVLAGPRYALDMVRVGLGLYGYAPAGFSVPALRPALRVYASVAAARTAFSGGAGYGSYAPRPGPLSVVRAGYADGFFRVGTGRNALCMDAFVAERAAQKYEDVCVFSDADAYALGHGTVSYEVLVRVCGRAVKEYVDG